MCGTTTIEFTCGHEDVHACPDGFCPIAYAQLFATQGGNPVVPIRVAIPNKRVRLHCWQEPQGFVQVGEICPQCQFRQEKYETSSTTVSMLRLSEAARDIRARAISRARSSSRSTTTSNTDNSSGNPSSTDTSPSK